MLQKNHLICMLIKETLNRYIYVCTSTYIVMFFYGYSMYSLYVIKRIVAKLLMIAEHKK